jgi:cytochrome oxidase Cu insertion factor (SCO1/SenC/PrrC family)
MSKAGIGFVVSLSLLGLLAAGLLWYVTGIIPQPGRIVSEGQAQIGGPYHLEDQNRRQVSNGDFRGRYQLIYFGYSYCPDVCPTTLEAMAQALSELGARGSLIVPIFITVDPVRDTPAALKSYLAAFSPRFVGLTGNQSQISIVEKEFHVYAQKRSLSSGGYAMDHSSEIYLLDHDGRLAAYYSGSISSQKLADDLRAKI